jgi:nitrogen fixation NifU-like protein
VDAVAAVDGDFEELYQSIILEHNRHPQNFGEMADADRVAAGYNANCGDDIRLYIRFSGGCIAAIQFSGEGCAISRASASLLTTAVCGLPRERAVRLAEEMLALLLGDGDVPADRRRELGQRAALLGVRRFPMRIKCATLAWHALLDGLESGEKQ